MQIDGLRVGWQEIGEDEMKMHTSRSAQGGQGYCSGSEGDRSANDLELRGFGAACEPSAEHEELQLRVRVAHLQLVHHRSVRVVGTADDTAELATSEK